MRQALGKVAVRYKGPPGPGGARGIPPVPRVPAPAVVALSLPLVGEPPERATHQQLGRVPDWRWRVCTEDGEVLATHCRSDVAPDAGVVVPLPGALRDAGTAGATANSPKDLDGGMQVALEEARTQTSSAKERPRRRPQARWRESYASRQ